MRRPCFLTSFRDLFCCSGARQHNHDCSPDDNNCSPDDNDDGTAETTWSLSDYYTLPLNGLGPDGRTGWPVNRLVAVDRLFPTGTVRPGVQITAKWGWSTPPEQVLLAVRLLFAGWYQRRATVTGGGSFEGWFASAIRDDSTVVDLLAPFRTGTAIAGMA